MKSKIYLAGGCFWGVEAYFKKVVGVLSTTVGYANGNSKSTSYERLKLTDDAETVEIIYDDNIVNVAELIERFFLIVDPFAINKQGNDIGRQYRSGIYYLNDYDMRVANFYKQLIEDDNHRKVMVEIVPLQQFIKAEDYHQDYLELNPNGYCHLNLAALNKPLSSKTKVSNIELTKLNLDAESLAIMLHKDTEHPFTSDFNDFNEEGIYIDKISKEALFSSEDKFDAGCGWPSFTKPITTDALSYFDDFTHNMYRTEVTSKIQASHLGHVFNDGPKDSGGQRYCINGKALEFIPISELKSRGYGKYLGYFKNFINKF